MRKLKLAILSFAFSFTACSLMFDEPTTTLLKATPNQARTKKVVLLENDGNATVDYSLQVSVLDNNYKLTGKELGNIFIADSNHGEKNLDSTSIKFNWISNDTLQIEYDKTLRTFIQLKKIDGVTIVYNAK